MDNKRRQNERGPIQAANSATNIGYGKERERESRELVVNTHFGLTAVIRQSIGIVSYNS
jgi:hypothetical protein